MNEISSIAAETAASAEEVVASAEQVNHHVAQVRGASSRLMEVAEELSQLVARFRLTTGEKASG